MLKNQRLKEMLAYIQSRGQVTVRELSEQFSVTDETVRRDVETLCSSYPLRKVHGGVMLLSSAERELPYATRKTHCAEEKAAIGRCAVGYLRDGDVIALDEGSTTEAMAEAVYGLKNLTVLAMSVHIALILTRKLHDGDFTGRVLLPEGEINTENGRIGGPAVSSCLRKYRFDKLFFSLTAVSDEGFSDWREEDGALTLALMERSEQRFCLAESEKIGKSSFYTFAPFSPRDKVITDDKNPLSEHVVSAMRQAGVELTVAGRAEHRA